MTLQSALRQLPGLLLVLGLVSLTGVLLIGRDAIVTVNARTETMQFAVCDETTLAHVGQARLVRTLGGSSDEVSGLLAVNPNTIVRVTRAGTGRLVLELVHDESVGMIGDQKLGSRAWVYVAPASDSGFVLPFVGEFTIGSVVGPTTPAVLLGGSIEVIERALLADATYVNLQQDLLPGDYIATQVDGLKTSFRCPALQDAKGDAADIDGDSTGNGAVPQGFVILSAAGTATSGGFHVHAEAAPEIVQLVRSARRPAIGLEATYWGRLREGTEFGVLVFILTCVAALAQIIGTFVPRESNRRQGWPAGSPTAHTALTPADAGDRPPASPNPPPHPNRLSLVVALGGIVLALVAARRRSTGREPS